MSITFVCDQCGTSYEVDNNLAGKAVRCRNCNDLNRVPQGKGTVSGKAAAEPAPTKHGSANPVTSANKPEPWYYWFLEGVARVMMFLDLIGWTLICIIIGLNVAVTHVPGTFGNEGTPPHDEVSVKMLIVPVLIWLCGLPFCFFIPAWILLCVNAARNLRRIRQSLVQ